MADGKPTDESVPAGKETDKPVENTDTPVSLYDKTEAIVVRGEAVNKEARAILEENKTLFANQRLAGTTGGKVVVKEPEKISDSDYADKLKRGEANPLEEDGISLNS